MCLILFAWQQHANYPLVLIANRDEYYARPTQAAHWWEDAPVFGGRDLEAGGTWLGIGRGGRFAAVTNVREAGGMKAGKISRGELTRGFLTGTLPAEDYLAGIAGHKLDYAGFNLLLGESGRLWYLSNRGDAGVTEIEAGVHGISNGALDEPWPKLASGRDELATLIERDPVRSELMEILTDHRIAEDHALPSTGVPLDIERMLSSRFIRSPDYGTRASTVLTIDTNGRVEFSEQNFGPEGELGERVEESFTIETI